MIFLTRMKTVTLLFDSVKDFVFIIMWFLTEHSYFTLNGAFVGVFLSTYMELLLRYNASK